MVLVHTTLSHMNRNFLNQFRSTAGLLLLGFLLLLLRAWPRLIHPEVWIEDGTQNLNGFINEGVINLLSPVGGYLVVVPKMITLMSLSISFIAYPLISTVVSWFFILFVFLVIARAPTYFRGQILLATSCFFIPSDPECFGLPMYTYWWSSLLLFVVIFWKESQNLILRMVLLVIASLSSPVCLVTLPLFWFRVWKFKKISSEMWLAIFATALSFSQLIVMIANSNPGQLNLSSIFWVIPTFFGSYLVGNLNADLNWIMGSILSLFLFIAMLKNRNWVISAVLYLLLASIFMSIYRVDIRILHPIDAGPRYFFFPYILLSWLLIQFLFGENCFIKVAASSFWFISCANAIPHLDRRHDSLSWREHVYQCAQTQTHAFPIHFAGGKNNVWNLVLTGEQCAKLIARDPFR